ncbi:putative efflux pump membrane fusion protein [Peptococcaceae bacterium CEB3]|nr:putative efflux pump membrane fusion protein [Peptococcaceae bacterium CEB3]
MTKKMRFKLTGVLMVFLLTGTLVGCGTVASSASLPVAVKVRPAAKVDLPVGAAFPGTVTPFVQTSIAPAISGILQTVKVRPGDKITEGQVLATLNTDQLQAQANQAATGIEVAQAQKQAAGEQTGLTVRNAEAALKTAQAGLNSAQTQGQNQVGAAQKALAAAEAKLSEVQTGAQNAVTQAQNGLAQAQAGVNQAQSAAAAAQAQVTAAQSRTASDLQTAQENATKAQDAMNTAESALQHAQQVAHSSTDPGLLAAQAAYDQAAIGYQTALGTLRAAQSDKSVSVAQAAYNQAQSALQAALSQVKTAQSALAAAQSGKDVQVAQATVNQAQQGLDAAQAGAASTVKSADAQVGQAQAAYQTALKNPGLVVNAAQIASAQASLRVIQASIDQGQILAPLNGYVVAVNAQMGQAVGPQGGFIVLSSVSPLIATVNVPDSQVSCLRVGMPMAVAVQATGQTYAGTLSAIHRSPVSDNVASRGAGLNYPVDIEITGSPQGLLSGMEVEAYAVDPGRQVTLIPANSAVNVNGNKGSVFLVRDGVARLQTVQLGNLLNLKWEGRADYIVTGGLSSGDKVIVRGQDFLRGGERVEASPSSASAND